MSLFDIISGMRVQSRLTWYNPYLDQKSGISPRKPGSFSGKFSLGTTVADYYCVGHCFLPFQCIQPVI